MLLKDGLFEGQSVGKKVMKMQVITESDAKADFAVSARRNAIFAIPIAVMIIPVLGWIIAPILSLVIVVMEFLKIKDDPKGRRRGDNWAGTQVIMHSEAFQAGSGPAPAGTPPVAPPEQADPAEPVDANIESKQDPQ